MRRRPYLRLLSNSEADPRSYGCKLARPQRHCVEERGERILVLLFRGCFLTGGHGHELGTVFRREQCFDEWSTLGSDFGR